MPLLGGKPARNEEYGSRDLSFACDFNQAPGSLDYESNWLLVAGMRKKGSVLRLWFLGIF